MQDIFIFGASDHARVVIDIVELEGKYRIAGVFDSFKVKGASVASYKVAGDEDELVRVYKKTDLRHGIIGIGDNSTRQLIAERLRSRIPDLEFVTAVHPSSTLSREVQMEGGVVVMARCYVGLSTRVGEGAVIGTNSILEHHGTMGAYSTLGAGTCTGGHVTLGEGAAVCLGATIIHGISIGNHSVIGAGSTVINDIPAGTVAYGVPARVVRTRNSSDSYLHIRSQQYFLA